jgi:hypothetical protein
MKTMSAIVALLALALSGCGSAGAQLDTSEPWDLVWFSDSRGFGVADAWADLIEETEGVDVRVHDHAIGGMSLVLVRQIVSEQATIRDEVADAEIIVVFGNPADSGGPVGPEDTGTCVQPSPTPRDPPERYSEADWAPFGDVLRDILDEIFELRAGQPTVVRVPNEFAAMIADWREAGIESECTAGWEGQSAVIGDVADEYGVEMASWYDAFNGPDHDEDPREKGYIASDGFHTSPDGTTVQAEVLHSLGYDTVTP